MTDEDLTAYVATLDKLPCGCTINHEHLCPDAQTLWEKIAGARDEKGKLLRSGLWSKYKSDPLGYRIRYFAATKEYLTHFENGHAPAPEPVAEAERVGVGV